MVELAASLTDNILSVRFGAPVDQQTNHSHMACNSGCRYRIAVFTTLSVDVGSVVDYQTIHRFTTSLCSCLEHISVFTPLSVDDVSVVG
jgi:hypothetical protein